MTKVEQARNLADSNLDVHLKLFEIGKIRAEVENNRFTCAGLSVLCVLFAICIIPLLALPLFLKNKKEWQRQLVVIDEIINDIKVAI